MIFKVKLLDKKIILELESQIIEEQININNTKMKKLEDKNNKKQKLKLTKSILEIIVVVV